MADGGTSLAFFIFFMSCFCAKVVVAKFIIICSFIKQRKHIQMNAFFHMSLKGSNASMNELELSQIIMR